MAQPWMDARFERALEWARWAVRRWSAFPVDQVPRPLVLVGGQVVHEGGFASSEAKAAFAYGRIEWTVETPDAVRAALVRNAPPERQSIKPLQVAAAQRGQRLFMTDRGPVELPAWRLEAEGALNPIWVLEPTVARWRPAPRSGGAPPDAQHPGQNPSALVTLDADGQSLTTRWNGGPPDLETYPQAHAVESDHAVAVIAGGVDHGSTGTFRTLSGHAHQICARLEHPLADRVVVNVYGHPLDVTRQ